MVKKVIHYRRADAHNSDVSLEAKMSESFDRLARPVGNVLCENGDIDFLVFRADNFYHFVIFEDGSKAATISLSESGQSPSIDEADTESDDEEFIWAQIFLLVDGDDVNYIVHNRGMTDSSVNTWVSQFVNFGVSQNQRYEIFLSKWGRREGVGPVLRDGIEKIDMNIGSLSTALESMRERSRLGTFFRNLDMNNDQVRAASEAQAKLVISSGRLWDGMGMKGLMQELSEEGMDEFGDSVKIYTKKGTVVTLNQLIIKGFAEIEGNRRILDAAQARAQLAQALTDFRRQELIH